MRSLSIASVLAFVLLSLVSMFGWTDNLGFHAQGVFYAVWLTTLAGSAFFRAVSMLTDTIAEDARRKQTASATASRVRDLNVSLAKRTPVYLASYRFGSSPRATYERKR